MPPSSGLTPAVSSTFTPTSTPRAALTGSSQHFTDAKALANLLRTKVLYLSKIIDDLSDESFAGRDVLERMRFYMPGVFFFLNVASHFFISIGAVDHNEADRRPAESCNSSQAFDQIRRFLQNLLRVRWRWGVTWTWSSSSSYPRTGK